MIYSKKKKELENKYEQHKVEAVKLSKQLAELERQHQGVLKEMMGLEAQFKLLEELEKEQTKKGRK